MCRNVDENELISEISDRIGEPLTEVNVDMLKRIFIEKGGISIEFAAVNE
ncbi:hypothetical protein SAMN02910265_01286 [Ruminococcus flavefaciens]|uniref:Uncharacterized protein n=1 Tax=Ruminococcus flavefaciens TaxID=1265 RepID=A0A1H6J287_RUMFL|nr:hypothetical protein [Ruminococcus flavefaciens]SEH52875.1 hypothetical protein SAMN02910265_01286 [Ruminococcus flavefaciens]